MMNRGGALVELRLTDCDRGEVRQRRAFDPCGVVANASELYRDIKCIAYGGAREHGDKCDIDTQTMCHSFALSTASCLQSTCKCGTPSSNFVPGVMELPTPQG